MPTARERVADALRDMVGSGPVRWDTDVASYRTAAGVEVFPMPDLITLTGADPDRRIVLLTREAPGRAGIDHAGYTLAEGRRLRIRRQDPVSVRLDPDHHLLRLLVTADPLPDIDLAQVPDQRRWENHGELAWAYPVDEVFARGAGPVLEQFRRAASPETKVRTLLEGGLSEGAIQELVTVWSRAIVGDELDVERNVAPDRTSLLISVVSERLEHQRRHEAHIASLRASGAETVGGFPADEPWATLPGCGWRDVPDQVFPHEEFPLCSLPSTCVAVETEESERPPFPVQAYGGDTHPYGVGVCPEHLTDADKLGWALLHDPRSAPATPGLPPGA